MANEDIKKLQNKLKKLAEQLENNKTLDKIASTLKKQIVNRSRVSGMGVNKSGDLYKFPELSEKYVEQRKKTRKNDKKRKNENKKVILSTKTTPKKSNITATGSLLDSVDYEVGRNYVKLYLKDTPRKTLTGKDSSTTNSEVAKGMLEKYEDGKSGGRRFFALSKVDKKTISDFIAQAIRKILDQN